MTVDRPILELLPVHGILVQLKVANHDPVVRTNAKAEHWKQIGPFSLATRGQFH